MSDATEWQTVWVSPGERMLVQSQTEAGYTRHRYVSNGEGDGAVAVAMADGKTLFIELFRPATGVRLVELPRGQADAEDGGDPRTTALRELFEETGWRAREAEVVGRAWSDSGLCGDHTNVVRCTDLEAPSPQQAALAEISHLRWFTPDEIRDGIAAGEIADGLSIAALAMAKII